MAKRNVEMTIKDYMDFLERMEDIKGRDEAIKEFKKNIESLYDYMKMLNKEGKL